MRRALAPVGEELEAPRLHFDGTAVFGMVPAGIPHGEEALQVFDGIWLLASSGHFAEPKRGRRDLSYN